jgi:DNA-binding transcriptional ArsR family regulator
VARKGEVSHETTRPSRAGASVRPAPVKPGVPELDRIIHERVRLAIVSALAVNDAMTFGDLKALLAATDGNLSVHARKLEEAGYIHCTKGFDGTRAAHRVPPGRAGAQGAREIPGSHGGSDPRDAEGLIFFWDDTL